MNLRAFVLVALAPVVLVLPAPQVLGAPRAQPFIAQVNTDALLHRLGLKARGKPMCGRAGVTYQVTEQRGFSEWITIGVFATPQIAKARYGEWMRGRRSYTLRGDDEPMTVRGVGDDLHLLGRTPGIDSSGVMFLRRRNVLIEVRWNADYKSGLRAAQRLDNILLNAPEIAPKGARAALPDVRLEMVPRETTVGKSFYARFRSRGGSVLASADVAFPRRGWASYGSVSGYSMRAGRHVQEFDFASWGNVFASRTVSLNVTLKRR